jgi:hypothetical protein
VNNNYQELTESKPIAYLGANDIGYYPIYLSRESTESGIYSREFRNPSLEDQTNLSANS